MEKKMKNHQINEFQKENLLQRVQTAIISMKRMNNYSYDVPIHYVYENNKIFFYVYLRAENG